LKFEYKPYFLAEWVKKEIKVQDNYYESEEFLNSVEDLRGLIHFYNNRSEEDYHQWFNGLLTKTVIIFPFVIQEIKNDNNKKLTEDKLLSLANDNRQLFIKNPTQFAPQYGGYCSQGMVGGIASAANPRAWKIVDGKLYLFAGQQLLARWQENNEFFVHEANAQWPKVLAELEKPEQ